MPPVTHIKVTITDLEVLRATIGSVYNFSQTLDLQDQYRKLANRRQDSALTKACESCLEKLEAYIVGAEEDDDEE